MDNYIGKMLDNRYEILEQIGTGGMANVYKARCHRLNRLVAVKILKDEYAQDADFLRRFHTESQAVAMLSHPNIVSVYDVSKSSENQYIVMELIDGISLKEYMQKKGALTWREALHFITQIMKALEHAHSRGIIHRDIKPHNIMTLRDGSVRVTDFGIAHLATTQNTLTPKEALGSVHYISPEQAKGEKLDFRTDIYSAGVVLYEMLTNKLPFDGETPVAVALQHINSTPVRPREINPDIPEGLEEITMRAMNCDINKRFPSATEMLKSLEEFRQDPSINFSYDVDVDSEGLNDAQPKKNFLKRVYDFFDERRRFFRESDKSRDRSKRAGRVSVFAGIAAVLAFILLLTYFLWTFFFQDLFVSSPEIAVPDLVGKMVTDVVGNDLYSSFNIVEAEQKESDVYGEGTILEQVPSSGTLVKKGNSISLTVSAGSEIINMPDIVGETWRQGQLSIKNELGERILYSIETFYMLSDDIEENCVISTEPEKGERLRNGANITVVISKGADAELVTVPSIVNSSLDEATGILAGLGLSIGNVSYGDSELPEGTVLTQNYAPGCEVEKGSVSVDVHVSNGSLVKPEPEPEPEPDSGTAEPVEQTPGGRPSGTEYGEKVANVKVSLPSGDGTAYVEIWQDDIRVIADTYDRSLGTVELRLTGKGQSSVSAYVDGVLIWTDIVDFEYDGN